MQSHFRKLVKLIEDLGWDYQRMSTSGQQTYDEIIEVLERVIEEINHAAADR